MIPPLLRLRLCGLFCPCLEKDEDATARAALSSLTSSSYLPPIRWHRKVRSSSSNGGDGGSAASAAAAAMGGLVSGLFGSSRSGPGAFAGGGGLVSGGASSWAKEKATLSVSDTSSGPAIVVEALPDGDDGDNDNDDHDHHHGDEDARNSGSAGDGGAGSSAPAPKKKKLRSITVPLRRVGSVSAATEGSFLGMVSSVGGGGLNSGIALYAHGGDGVILLRFDVMNEKGRGVNAERRDEIVHKIRTLVEWDRRRRAALDENAAPDDAAPDEAEAADSGDDDDDVDGGGESRTGGIRRNLPGGIIKGHAQKMAHFAKREIEMREQRREREKRKARYLEGAGGLKYTAVAMANRAMD